MKIIAFPRSIEEFGAGARIIDEVMVLEEKETVYLYCIHLIKLEDGSLRICFKCYRQVEEEEWEIKPDVSLDLETARKLVRMAYIKGFFKY